MTRQNFGSISLCARTGGRKYLNSAERERFLLATNNVPIEIALFGRLLFWSGGRVSETLALTPIAFDIDENFVTFETLKRRRRGVLRHVPLPDALVGQLDRTFNLRARQRDPTAASQRVWPWSRATAWRHIKMLMAMADVSESAAMPKGLRHSFAVAAFRKSIPPHLVQRWLGHASLETTSIYGDMIGQEEREFASRLWRTH